MTLTVVRSTGQRFCRIFLHWTLSDVFLIISLQLKFCGEQDYGDKVLFSSQDIKGTLSLVVLTLTPSWGSVGFLTTKSLCVFPLSIVSSLEGRHYVQLTLKWKLGFHSLGRISKSIWNSAWESHLLLMHLFTYYIHTKGCLGCLHFWVIMNKHSHAGFYIDISIQNQLGKHSGT